MRKRLRALGINKSFAFTGCVHAIKDDSSEPRRIMVKDLRYKGVLIEHHVWLHIGESYRSLDIRVGDFLRFKSRIIFYLRRKLIQRYYAAWEYGLDTPTRIEKLTIDDYKKTIKK